MSTADQRFVQARDHLNQLVSLYAFTDDEGENSQILRDLEWLVEHMAELSSEEFLDTVAPQMDGVSPGQPASSEPKRRSAA